MKASDLIVISILIVTFFFCVTPAFAQVGSKEGETKMLRIQSNASALIFNKAGGLLKEWRKEKAKERIRNIFRSTIKFFEIQYNTRRDIFIREWKKEKENVKNFFPNFFDKIGL